MMLNDIQNPLVFKFFIGQKVYNSTEINELMLIVHFNSSAQDGR